ncbi:hydroxyproline-rich glycoprotein family protein [Wolffia australiana]
MEGLSISSSKYVSCPLNPLQLARPKLSGERNGFSRRVRFRVSSHVRGSGVGAPNRPSETGLKGVFASVSSSSTAETSSIGTPKFPIPPPSPSIGSPLLWIGVGVGLSALFSWGSGYLKQYAMKQAMNTLMGQMAAGNKDFKKPGFTPGPTYPFPSAPFPPQMATSPAASASPSASVIDTPLKKVETKTVTEVKVDKEKPEEPKRYSFVDVSPEEISQREPPVDSNVSVTPEVVSNGSSAKPNASDSQEQYQSRSGKGPSLLSVDALEKMMEDPTVQKMVYPYLPEEMRNPTTFKWMLQNPEYREQLQEMLDNMGGGGSSEWDNRMMDSLKNFDISSPEVKQQFEQIGLTPEEVISKIMANPDIAMAFQNPRVQAAIMDCSQNPFSITKYQNDKEVMDVLNKISELFPGASGPF